MDSDLPVLLCLARNRGRTKLSKARSLGDSHAKNSIANSYISPIQVSAVAMFNSIQNYTTIALTQRVYSKRPQDVNTLSSRTFGTWTFLSAIVRCYAAYNIANQGVYDICIWSYLIAGAHFVSEWLIFGTAR